MRSQKPFAVQAASAALALGLIVPTAAWGQEVAETRDPDQEANQRAAAVQENVDNAGNILTDADRTHWLAAKLKHAAQLRQFAAERTTGGQIQSFAKQSAETLQQQATLLEQAAQQHTALRPDAAESAAATDPDLSETVEEIGEAVRERLRQRAERRGEALAASDEPEVVEDDPALAGRRDPSNARRERLLSGRGDREAARERLRVLLPALREELPDLFEVLGEAVEDETVGSAAWVDYQGKVAERVLQAKQEELQRYEGREFDQAFLGMALVEAIELEAIAKTVTEQATPSLQEMLQATARQLREQAETSRDLMEQQYSREGSQISSNRQPTEPAIAK